MPEFDSHGSTKGSHEAFLRFLASGPVPAKQRPYYVGHVRQFVRAIEGKNPRSLDRRQIHDALSAFGRRPDILDWQFSQLIDAVRLYTVHFLKLAEARQIDWGYWKSSARNLDGDHATMPPWHVGRNPRSSCGRGSDRGQDPYPTFVASTRS